MLKTELKDRKKYIQFLLDIGFRPDINHIDYGEEEKYAINRIDFFCVEFYIDNFGIETIFVKHYKKSTVKGEGFLPFTIHHNVIEFINENFKHEIRKMKIKKILYDKNKI